MTATITTPQHTVLAAQTRANIVQGEFGRQHAPGSWLPYIHDHFENLPGIVAALIRRNRPVEAEATLLQAERFVGCISDKQCQDRIGVLVVSGGDESWT